MMASEERMDFTRLLQESRQLNVRIRSAGHGTTMLPELQRGLEQIQELSGKLAGKVSSPLAPGMLPSTRDPALRERAALFLASRGFDLVDLEESVRRANSAIPKAELTGAAEGTVEGLLDSLARSSGPIERDLDRYLDREHEIVISRAVEEAQVRVDAKLEEWCEQRGQEKWQEFYKTRLEPILEAREKAGTGLVAPPKLCNIPKAVAYSRVIRVFNEARLRGSGGSFSLVREFVREIKATLGDDLKGEMLLDAWRMLRSLLTFSPGDHTGEDLDGALVDGGLENVFQAVANDFSSSYAAGYDSLDGAPWKRQLVAGGRRYLEEVYMRFVDRTLAQYPRDALLGGRPSRVERIRAFCEIKAKRLTPTELVQIEMMLVGPTIISGSSGSSGGALPVWMIIFYMVRCGLLREALSWAQNHEVVIQRTDPHFLAFFRSFVDGDAWKDTTQGQIRAEYGRLIASTQNTSGNAMAASSSLRTIDPFRLSLYKIMGRCELSRKNIGGGLVIQSSEDWVWLQFWLIEDVFPEPLVSSAVTYSLIDLQRIVVEYGPKHFDPNSTNAWHYFTVLALVGLFEKGIEYLHQTGQTIDAVHFATAMVDCGTLQLHAGKLADSLFIKKGSSPQHHLEVSINYAGMLLGHSRLQQKDQPRDIQEALNTILLMTLPRTPHYPATVATTYRTLALDALRDLVLSSGDVAGLLGDVRADGTVRPGNLLQYGRLLGWTPGEEAHGGDGFIRELTQAAAERCHQEGKFRESLQLFNLARHYDRVVEILCSRMSIQFLRAYEPLEVENIRQTAESILNYYASQANIAVELSPKLRATCSTLLAITEMRKYAEEGKWSLALTTLQSLGGSLLPPFLTTYHNNNSHTAITEGGLTFNNQSGNNSVVDIGAIRATAERTKDMASPVVNIFPETLLLSMQVISRRMDELKGHIGMDGGRGQEMERLKRMARTLMTFMGMLPIRIPQEIFVQMTRLEISL